MVGTQKGGEHKTSCRKNIEHGEAADSRKETFAVRPRTGITYEIHPENATRFFRSCHFPNLRSNFSLQETGNWLLVDHPLLLKTRGWGQDHYRIRR